MLGMQNGHAGAIGTSPIYSTQLGQDTRHLPQRRKIGRAMVPENISFQRSHIHFG
jgi:hypothetical protein